MQGSRAHADAVAQGWCRSILNGARVENQLGAHAAFGLRKPGAIQTHGACVEAGAVGHIGKPGRQVVFKLDLTQQLTAAVFDFDAVVNKLAQIDRVSRSDFFNEQATQGAGIERHIDMHWPRSQINRELAAVGAFRICSPACRQERRRKHRRKTVAARWCHQQLVGAGCDGWKLILAGYPGHHRVGGGRHAISLKHHCGRIGADVEQGHGCSAHGNVGTSVIHHAIGVDEQINIDLIRTTTQHGGPKGVVFRGIEYGVTRATSPACESDARHDAESSCVQTRLSRDVALNIARDGRLDDDGVAFSLCRIKIALRCVGLHINDLLCVSHIDRLRESGVPEIGNRRRQLGHRCRGRVRIN